MREGKIKQLGIHLDTQLLKKLVQAQDSRTWRRSLRAPYWPQAGQAVCGRCLARQAGFAHVANVGTAYLNCERRCRVLLRDIFRFGTATSSPRTQSSGLQSVGLGRPVGQPSPTGVNRVLVLMVRFRVEVGAADEAQPRAIGPTERRER